MGSSVEVENVKRLGLNKVYPEFLAIFEEAFSKDEQFAAEFLLQFELRERRTNPRTFSFSWTKYLNDCFDRDYTQQNWSKLLARAAIAIICWNLNKTFKWSENV